VPDRSPTDKPRRQPLYKREIFFPDTSLVQAFNAVRWWPTISIMLGPILAAVAYSLGGLIPVTELPPDARTMLAIFVLAGWYWTSGAIPPFATAVMIMGLSVFLIGLDADGRASFNALGSEVSGWREFIAPAAAPVIVLMLGGFVLGEAAHKHGIDRALAGVFIKPFAGSPPMLILGVLAVTATFSMWMSNTATAAMMTTLIAPIVGRMGEGSKVGRALLLAVSVGANVGGMGTPIGTPPNALAFGSLMEAGYGISFMKWMLFAVPIVVVLLLVSWWFLVLTIPKDERKQPMDLVWGGLGESPGWSQWVVSGTFALTVLMWVTSQWTHIPIAVTAMVPLVVFTATQLLNRKDINGLDWDIILLMAGGLCLGHGLEATHLASWFVGVIPFEIFGTAALVAVLATAALTMSTFMSNTASANLLLPIAVGIAAAIGDVETQQAVTVSVAVAVALGASLAMALPVSTPPNAIVFATGQLKISDFVKTSVVISTLGLGIATVLCVFVVPLLASGG
jgi:sodium-dependent dicarboxylate transporter 2/3/5